MATFTFGSGNARKILGAPMYALGALASFLVPRSDTLWVFGSGIGLGEGALPLYELARERVSGTRLVWLARSDAELIEAQALGFDTMKRDSWHGFLTTLRSSVVVVTHGFGDVNRYGTRGAFVVQLWHGIPFKHLHLDSRSTYKIAFAPDIAPLRRLVGAAYRRAGRAISLFPVSSKLVAISMASGFGVDPKRIAVTGDPRDDVLLRGSERARQELARERLTASVADLPPGASIILFTPTWRDGNADPTLPTSTEWTTIVAWLEAHDAVLIVRPHPLGRGDYSVGAALSPRVRLMGPDVQRDINPVLWAVDLLVTDYSSIVFDYALVGRPIVFFAPDLDAYTQSRGFYIPFDEFTDGRAVTTWKAALQQMEQAMLETPTGIRHKHARHLRQKFFDVTDGMATERVLERILRRDGTGER